VQALSGPSESRARDALAVLCQAYWYPVYSYLRGRGCDADKAKDLTQAFFARLLEKHTLKRADPERGRFRTFLLASLTNFVSNERVRSERRRGGSAGVSLDAPLETAEQRYALELRDDLTPEELYYRRWVSVLLARVLNQLRDEFADSDRTELFDGLKGYLTGGKGAAPYETAASRLGMTEGALKVAIHRLRRRYRELLHEEVARTVATSDDVAAEMQDLLGALRAQRRDALSTYQLVLQNKRAR
jgi:RNA polymerase sigma factor (sigma-70 family)